MARSTYVYVVVADTVNGEVVQATFTVKHECLRWLRAPGRTADGLYVGRYKDGGEPGRVSRTASNFLAENP